MINSLGRSLLVATSLAPVCGAFAVNQISDLGWLFLRDYQFWLWLSLAFALVVGTLYFLEWTQTRSPQLPITTRQIKQTDKDVLAFLLAYLLPLLGKDSLALSNPITVTYIIGLIFLVVYHSNSFHFNPMMALLGYHFYEIETDGGYNAILVSKTSHATQSVEMTVIKISDFFLLEVESRFIGKSNK